MKFQIFSRSIVLWIPACAGMTNWDSFQRLNDKWIPACAGMTKESVHFSFVIINIK